MSKSVVKKLSAAALTLMPPCAAAVRCYPHRHMHVCAVACLPSRNVSVFEKGNVIGESVYLESSCDIECSVISGPSAAPPAPHADVAEEASRMTSWASWVHPALRCLRLLAEAMSSHGVAPQPWAFSISSHVALMDSLKGDPCSRA